MLRDMHRSQDATLKVKATGSTKRMTAILSNTKDLSSSDDNIQIQENQHEVSPGESATPASSPPTLLFIMLVMILKWAFCTWHHADSVPLVLQIAR